MNLPSHKEIGQLPPANLFDEEEDEAESPPTAAVATPTSVLAAVKSQPDARKTANGKSDDFSFNAATAVVETAPKGFKRSLSEQDFDDFSIDKDDDEYEAMEEELIDDLKAKAPSLKDIRKGGIIANSSGNGRRRLYQIPEGWIRKVVVSSSKSSSFQSAFYYNKNGKRFSNMKDVDQYFAKLGYSIDPKLFNFSVVQPPPKESSTVNKSGNDCSFRFKAVTKKSKLESSSSVVCDSASAAAAASDQPSSTCSPTPSSSSSSSSSHDEEEPVTAAAAVTAGARKLANGSSSISQSTAAAAAALNSTGISSTTAASHN